jgi:hypothetical protein
MQLILLFKNKADFLIFALANWKIVRFQIAYLDLFCRQSFSNRLF